MPIFSIETETILGISHSGEVTAEGEGTVELTDEEVQQLIDLIRENGGETNVEKLHLEEKYPEIYEMLDEAYRETARQAEYNHWVIEGYENGWYETELEEMVKKCEEKYGFHFEYDPKDYMDEEGTEVDEDLLYDDLQDAFYEWVSKYRGPLDEQEDADFLSDVFCLEPNVDDVDYDVQIPPAIIKMAKDGQ